VRTDRDEVANFNVELDHHDVVLAEGLSCETYLETGNRGAFANGGAAIDLHPDVAVAHGRRWRWTDGAAKLALPHDIPPGQAFLDLVIAANQCVWSRSPRLLIPSRRSRSAQS
jgi:hypothetical protein